MDIGGGGGDGCSGGGLGLGGGDGGSGGGGGGFHGSWQVMCGVCSAGGFSWNETIRCWLGSTVSGTQLRAG